MTASPFTGRHLRRALAVLAVFLLLNAWIAWRVRHAYDPSERLPWMVLAVPLGPLTGAVVRGWPKQAYDACCIAHAFSVLRPCALVLALTSAAQWIGKPPAGRVRLALWTLGWILWFSGGIYSLAHSLS